MDVLICPNIKIQIFQSKSCYWHPNQISQFINPNETIPSRLPNIYETQWTIPRIFTSHDPILIFPSQSQGTNPTDKITNWFLILPLKINILRIPVLSSLLLLLLFPSKLLKIQNANIIFPIKFPINEYPFYHPSRFIFTSPFLMIQIKTRQSINPNKTPN